MTYRVGFVGTGANPDEPDVDGYAMAYQHASGYRRLDECEIVACADIVPENAAAFAETFDIDAEHVFEDHEEMLANTDLDIVSVCTPPAVHADIVISTARSGTVQAIHCEKPMADTWGDCKRMTAVCEDEGVQLTFNHQMRFGKPFSEAKSLIDEGRVGRLRRFEFGDTTLYDMGTHLFDLCNFYNDGTDVEWVLAQIDYTEENLMFGTHNENQAISQWRYENGVFGLASTGRGDDFTGCYFRVLGTDGAIEIGADEATLRYRHDGSNWRTVDTAQDNIHGPYPDIKYRTKKRLVGTISNRLAERFDVPSYVDRAIEEVVTALQSGEPSELSARNALPAQEVIFASWESARRRGRVDLPLEVDDNALTSMVESGELQPE